jgi:hypothetical protein
VTTRVGPATSEGDEIAELVPELVAGYLTLQHAATSISRTARAYSNVRTLWWPLAYLDLPMLWSFHALSIARRPDQLVTLGSACAQLNSSTAGAKPRTAKLLWVLFLADLVVLIGVPVALVDVWNTLPALIIATLWWLLLLLIPFATYGVPALIQQYRARGLGGWKSRTLEQTGRTPVLVSQLGAWPCTGGGRRGTGDGFTLMTELAGLMRAEGQIMVGVARSKKLTEKYVADTAAQQSTDNPRHLRWP